MNRDQKAAVIDEVAAQIQEAQAIFAVDYRGLSVRQAADLRGRLIEIDANLRVVKNTLTERAADKAGIDALKQFLEGPTAFTFVNGDPVLAAKALAGFRREAQLPGFKGGWMDGRELSIEDIEALSRLPSLDVMHGQLVGMIAAPLSGLVRTLNALLSGIAVALGQVQEQGLVGQGAPGEGSSADAGGPPANGGDEGVAAAAAAPAAEAAAPAEAVSADAGGPPANGGDEGVAAEAAAPAAEAAAPAEAVSADAGGPPANGGDEGVAAEAAAPAAEAAPEPVADAPVADAPVADAPVADAPVADAPVADAPVDAEAAGDSSPAEAVGAEDSPSAPAEAPDPTAAEEIPNQPMPAPEQAPDAGNDNETSNEEGDN